MNSIVTKKWITVSVTAIWTSPDNLDILLTLLYLEQFTIVISSFFTADYKYSYKEHALWGCISLLTPWFKHSQTCHKGTWPTFAVFVAKHKSKCTLIGRIKRYHASSHTTRLSKNFNNFYLNFIHFHSTTIWQKSELFLDSQTFSI